jgi:quercetin dioxygenase-like cupin family protein
MRASGYALLVMAIAACGRDAAPDPPPAAKPSSAFDAAAGVQRADSGAGRDQPRLVPLRALAGDVEILYGDPEKAGEPFVMRIRELPGSRIPLHSHPVDENITVVQGVFHFAVGERWDEAALTKLEAGGYAFVPKGSTMYGYSPEGAVVQVHGVVPFDIHWHGGLETLDDPDARRTFTYRKGDAVQAPRGSGTIRQGYASGAIVQYEIVRADGTAFMADQSETRRRPAP